MHKRVAVLFLCSALVQAADFTGRWAGSVRTQESGQPKTYPMALALRQEGGELIGVITDEHDHDIPMLGGIAREDRVTFTLRAPNGELGFDLVLHATRLEGTAKFHGSDERTAQVSLERLAAAASLTGVWVGGVEIDPARGPYPVSLRMVQSGAKLGGTAFMADGKQSEVAGRLEGSNAVFEMTLGGENVRFELRREGDQLTGRAAKASAKFARLPD